jgi:hypothetical protein
VNSPTLYEYISHLNLTPSLPLPLQNSEAMISIDMPAGPSEVLVIADGNSNPVHVASDLLSQVLTFSFLFFHLLLFYLFIYLFIFRSLNFPGA